MAAVKMTRKYTFISVFTPEITATLKGISSTTRVILATNKLVSASDKVIYATTKWSWSLKK